MTKLSDIPERFIGEDGAPREREAHLKHLRELLTKHAFDEDYARKLRGRIAELPAAAEVHEQPDANFSDRTRLLDVREHFRSDRAHDRLRAPDRPTPPSWTARHGASRLEVGVESATCDRCGVGDPYARRISMVDGLYTPVPLSISTRCVHLCRVCMRVMAG
jgi:ribosomal protein S14